MKRAVAIEDCKRCSRLIKYCQKIAVEKRASFKDDRYWGRPVPNFGSTQSQLLIVGLAPAAHGANRTGRMFTGDRSGEWLYRALYEFGFATEPESKHHLDSLELIDTQITAVTHCAPPDNKPTPEEIRSCSEYLEQTLKKTPFKVVLVLGQIAQRETLRHLRSMNLVDRAAKFSHGGELKLIDGRTLLMSYHPSQQNTFTGRLTKPMWNAIFSRCRELISS